MDHVPSYASDGPCQRKHWARSCKGQEPRATTDGVSHLVIVFAATHVCWEASRTRHNHLGHGPTTVKQTLASAMRFKRMVLDWVATWTLEPDRFEKQQSIVLSQTNSKTVFCMDKPMNINAKPNYQGGVGFCCLLGWQQLFMRHISKWYIIFVISENTEPHEAEYGPYINETRRQRSAFYRESILT